MSNINQAQVQFYVKNVMGGEEHDTSTDDKNMGTMSDNEDL